MSQQQYSRIACVTGANKGIGLAIVRQLALQYPSTPYAQHASPQSPLLIYLTARDTKRGQDALTSLVQHDEQLKQARALVEDGGTTQIKYLPLDITSQDSISSFVDTLRTTHPDGIDILVNNAGVALQGFDKTMARDTIGTNYHGAVTLTNNLLPMIRDGGRIVNVASMAGYLTTTLDASGARTRGYSNEVRQKFLTARSIDDISALMTQFVDDVAHDRWRETWPGSAYGVSKAGLVGTSRVWAAALRQQGSTTLVNACCPGYVSTDMTGNKGHKEVDEGATTPVLLALGDIGGTSGEFWKDERVVPWERVTRE